MKKCLIAMIVIGTLLAMWAVAHDTNSSHWHYSDLSREDLLGPDGKPFTGDETIYAHPDSPAWRAGSDGRDIGLYRVVPGEKVVLRIGELDFTMDQMRLLHLDLSGRR